MSTVSYHEIVHERMDFDKLRTQIIRSNHEAHLAGIEDVLADLRRFRAQAEESMPLPMNLATKNLFYCMDALIGRQIAKTLKIKEVIG